MTYDLYSPLLRALAKFGNNQSELARQVGVHKSTVHNWIYRNKKIPIAHVLKISEKTGIPAWKLRPDEPQFFPHPLV